MKFNLKNRPTGDGVDTTEFCIKADDWFEGFEKELRESLIWLETMWHPRKDVEVAKRQAFIDKIKDVLGES